MLIAKVENSAVVSTGYSHLIFPHTSLPADPVAAQEYLATQGYYIIKSSKANNPATQKVMDVSPYFENGSVYAVQVVDLTEQELANAEAIKQSAQAFEVRADRDKRLADTDWRFRVDMTPSQEWKDYCQALRDIPQQSGFPWTVTWPNKPA